MFMLYCTFNIIKERDKMQVDTFILLFFCYHFGVDTMIFIPIVIIKEIVFNYLIYTTTIYH